VLTVLSRDARISPAPGPAFTAERNVDAQCPQERLRATQAASKRAGILGQPVLSLEIVSHCGRQSARGGRRCYPQAMLGHDLPHAGRDGISIDNVAFYRRPAIGCLDTEILVPRGSCKPASNHCAEFTFSLPLAEEPRRSADHLLV
jgi:hypothetical protein